ncbi:MAG: formylglycine-generating enzyme family protein [Pseudomonadota bacterium]
MATLVVRLICILIGFAGTPSAAEERYTLTDGSTVEPLDQFKECDVCPEMIVLPLGSFMMGAPQSESEELERLWGNTEGRLTEGPVHEVQIDIPFAMGRNEVTHDEWALCVEDGGCSHLPDRFTLTEDGNIALDGRSPVNEVSYLDALKYVAWLNSIIGEDAYRLPTEAEWEYAARAGTTTIFAQGNALTKDQANFIGLGDGTPSGEVRRDPTDHKTPISVDRLDASNPWGLRHMSGNVLERTMSCWTERHVGLSTSSAYLDLASQEISCRRVSKGGSYISSFHSARPAVRGRGDEDWRGEIGGFRILRQFQVEQEQ